MSDLGEGEALNQLLERAHDSAEGFQQGASLARNPALKTLFRERAQERDQLIGAIEAEARSFGAAPAQDGTMVGVAHQLFTYVRDALARDSDKGLVEELVRREGLVTQAFKAVVDDRQAPEKARKIAADALAKLDAERAELEDLRQQFR